MPTPGFCEYHRDFVPLTSLGEPLGKFLGPSARWARLLRPKRSAGTLGAIPLIVWLTGFKKAGNFPLFKDWINGDLNDGLPAKGAGPNFLLKPRRAGGPGYR